VSRGGTARVRSGTVRVRDQFVLARYGRTSRDLYRSKLSPPALETISVPGDRWVDFSQFIETTELACTLFAQGDMNLCQEIGAFGAEANMGVWRAMVYRVLSPQTVLSIAGGLWGHHYEGGRLSGVDDGEGGVRLRLEDFPTPHITHCLSIQGWLRRTLELGRPKAVRIQKRMCRLRGDALCEFHGQWK
jgi:hypothetical protein